MLFRKKDKKKKKGPERFEELKANGKVISAINFSIRKDGEDSARIEIITPDVCEDLHYDEVNFDLKTGNKLLKVNGTFLEARDEKRFKVYFFKVVGYEQFYV